MKNKSPFPFYIFIILLIFISACNSDQSTNDSAQMDIDLAETEDIFTDEASESANDLGGLDLGEKIIENASLSFETARFTESMEFINKQIDAFGAVLESSTKGQSGSTYGFMGEYISMTLRLPNDSLHPFIAELEQYNGLFLQHEDISRVDVTKEFRDNETRIAVLKEEEEALRKMLQEQGTLEEVLQIRTRLSEIIAEREIYENENQYYNDQSEFSTVYLSIQESDRASTRNTGNFWDRISIAFVDSFYRFIAVIQNLMIGLVYFIPYLIILSVFGLLIYYIRQYLRKNKL